ncbi:hypothetical protein [uncultured Mediterranean phage]|nr:hypothetical protein [uncultured Mediterranean phage]
MSIQSVVNTNASSVTDFNGNRGNFPQGVMAYNMGTSASGAGATQAFGATSSGTAIGLFDGTEAIGAYCGGIKAGSGAAAGVVQLITMTFATPHGWSSKTHDIDVTMVGAAAEAAALTVGSASGSFGSTTTIEVRREAGAVAGTNANLQAATMLVQIRERGVAQPNA